MRLDVYLTENKICKSRAAAQSLIKNGGVTLNGKAVTKNSIEVSENDIVSVIEQKQLKYVGRGGLKLERALELWRFDLNGALCVDIGASTGGFTDCMLQNGARKVYAVDVGRDQLDGKLRADSRVVSLEQTDIRDFSLPENEQADFIGTDVSFISLKMIFPHIYRLLKSGGYAVTLIKPQFEAGRKNLSKKGIVRDEKVRLSIVENIKNCALQCGFEIIGTEVSPITGGDGNTEYLLALRK
ncbi:MAG: TlyA family RNA methyltransferase [Oscillospiraceae bacterium]|nr:TlyA family RNA methyltransferase [Oscillospiraceae bacterium]